MVHLFGTSHDIASLAARGGSLHQFGGVRLSTLGDGPGRGMRVLDFETGSGLRMTVHVDRAMDIAQITHRGRPLGWQSAAGAVAPAHYDADGEGGLGWNRTFTGFLATCGLDHIFGPEEVPADTYNYPRKAVVRHGLHGRIGAAPARLTGYGERWSGDTCTLWAEGDMVQATLFGEALRLTRRIEVDLGSDTITLHDRVVNTGFARTPHMMMYHINLGYPLLDEASRFIAPIDRVIWASHGADLAGQGVGYDVAPAPRDGFAEQVWQHALRADPTGRVPMALVNDALGLGVMIETDAAAMPCTVVWQNFQAGHYVLGLEPATHHVLGNTAARERGEMIWLTAGQTRDYHSTFRVLPDAAAIADAETRIRAIAGQPDTAYPVPDGKFPLLHGAAQGAMP